MTTPSPRARALSRSRLRALRACGAALAVVLGMNAPLSNASALQLARTASRQVAAGKGSPLDEVSCTSATYCLAVASVSDPAAIYASSDLGATWHELSTIKGLATNDSLAPRLSCAGPHCVLVHDTSIYYSTDRGASWAEALPPAPAQYFGDVVCRASGLCVAVGNSKPLYSDDGGQNWQFAKTTWPYTDDELVSVSCPSSASCLAVGWTSKLLGAYSTNGGATWSKAVSMPKLIRHGLFYKIACATGRDCIAVATSDTPTSSDHFDGGFMGYMGLSYTADGGRTWSGGGWPSGVPQLESNSQPDSATEFTGVSCPTAKRCVAVASNITYNNLPTSGFAYHSADGGHTWSGAQALGAPAFGTLSCPSALKCVATSEAAPYYSKDGGASWAPGSPSRVPG